MTCNFSLAFAAVTLRLYVPGAMAAGIAFEVAYPAVAWLCWVPNLVAARWIGERVPGCATAAAPRRAIQVPEAASGIRRRVCK
jgi:hypothetical protein